MKKFSLLTIMAVLSLGLTLAVAQKKHTVVKGNTLSGLAKEYYNDAKKWRTIFDANQGKDLEVTGVAPKRLVNPNLIYPGQVLVIPNVADTGAMSDADIAKAMVGEWVESKSKTEVKFNADGTFTFGDKKGKYAVKNGNVELEGLGTFKPDQAKLKAGTISITQLKDAKGADVKGGAVMELTKKGGTKTDTKEVKKIAVAGKVTDKDGGKALAGVKVSSGSVSATTGADGSYKLDGVEEGKQVTFTMADYKTETKNAAATVDAQLTSTKPKIVSAKGTVSVKAGKAGKEKGVPGVKLTGKNTTTFKATDKGKGDYDVEMTYEEGKTPQIAAELAKYEVKSQNYTGGNATILLNAPAKKTKEKKTKDKKKK